jgi:amino-acid N-acetyltransferase
VRQDAAAEIDIRSATPGDLQTVLGLLEKSQLPTVEVERWLDHFHVAMIDRETVGVAGLEIHGSDAILRSVAVDESRRGLGIGARLTDAIIRAAKSRGLANLYLLTTTADDYFPRHGFRTIPRAEASADVRQSIEFREACPASATVMVLELT